MTQRDTTSSVSALRKQLLKNGFVPLPNLGKANYMTGWPSLEVTEEAIDKWGRRHKRFADTGLRIEGGLAVLDLDINNEEAINAIAAELEKEEPLLSQALVRFGKGAKEAWFVRTSEPFTRIHTRRWLAPGEDLERDGAHAVEAFGGASPRQFGAFGAHTRGAGGDVEIAYEWAQNEAGEELSPLTVPLELLPEFDRAAFFRFIDICERVLERMGWTPVKRSEKGESEAQRVFDLTEDMVFETNTGEDGLPFAALRARAGEEGLRVSASFIEPGAGHSRTRGLVGRTHSGDISIWDGATGITHLPADKAPPEALDATVVVDAAAVAERLKRLAQHESERKIRRRLELSSEDDLAQAAGKLLQGYALCPTQQLQVVPLWTDTINAGMLMANFRLMVAPWSEPAIGAQGQPLKTRISPADVWVNDERRLTVAGLQLRPDKQRPTFTEKGKTFINVYEPAVHRPVAGSSIEVGLDFMRQLLPDDGERAYFTQWLAFKYRHPEIPGPAVVMVARHHGTGRGTLGELIRRLFGQRYVKTLGFDHFAGRTYQSQYNDWGAESLFVLVNESSTADNGSSFRTKHDTYERLKEIVDPRPQLRQFIVKGKQAFDAPSFTSFVIATNNPDALPLPADDRRFWVGTNGEPREVSYWDMVNEWLEQPGNVAAFAAHLEAVDLSGYSPYATPPMTAAKEAMTELAASGIDRALSGALNALTGDLLLPDQIVEAMRLEKDANGYDFPDRWEAIARRAIQTKLFRLGKKDGPSWVVKIGNRKHPIYARTQTQAAKWSQADADDRRREVLRNGDPGSQKSIGEALAKLRLIVDNE